MSPDERDTAPRDRWRRARRHFDSLVELPVAERDARLAALEAEEPALAAELRTLLTAESPAAEGFLGEVAARRAEAVIADFAREALTAPSALAPGAMFGVWRLVAPLGHGGMAEVWEAERADGQFEQRAAVKILKLGMDSEEILRRFLTERQILAELHHPGIARLLDGGLAADGRPFFVLEKVDGLPIDEYAEKHRSSLAERIRLVLACCGALEAAHQRLVVHRDLKPSNILVDEAGRVKLLDFGIAKILTDEPGEGAHATRTDVRVLTPAYAAPEQILGGAVTTATDVYGLATVLYELLTGGLPQSARAGAKSATDLASLAASEAVERPSSAVGRPAAAATTAAGRPPRERRRWAHALRGDLDTVLLVALRREPERRYASVAAFAEDLQRCLEGRPISARPDTVGYRARKFARRHRLGVAAGALVALSLVGGLAAALWQARRAATAAESSLRAAEQASREARRAERVQEFLVKIFQVADPMRSGGETVSARELLEEGARRIDSELAAEPEVQGDLYAAVARIEVNLGSLDAAAGHARASLERRRTALGEEAPEVGESYAVLGQVEMNQGKLDEAERTLSRAIAILGRAGPAFAFHRAEARVDLGDVAFQKGQLARSERLVREALPFYEENYGTDSIEVAEQRRNLGIVLEELNRFDEALGEYRASRAVLEKRLGPDHPELALSDLGLAALLERVGQPREAERLYRHSLAVRLKTLGPDHPETGRSQSNLGRFLIARRALDEGERHAREAIRIFSKIDPDHFEVAKSMNDLALAELRRGHPAEAERLARETTRRMESALGGDHPFPWVTRIALGLALAGEHRYGEAETLLRRARDRIAETAGAESEYLIRAEDALGETQRALGRPAEAAEQHRAALGLARKVYGAEHPAAALAEHDLALDLVALGTVEGRAEATSLAAHAAKVLAEKDPDHWRRAEVEATARRLAAPDPAR